MRTDKRAPKPKGADLRKGVQNFSRLAIKRRQAGGAKLRHHAGASFLERFLLFYLLSRFFYLVTKFGRIASDIPIDNAVPDALARVPVTSFRSKVPSDGRAAKSAKGVHFVGLEEVLVGCLDG
ncbi:hypothetical protein [Hyphococcus luteus]|uniref:hypothetical protein n=1 Tax=Hyphococcus luteus TaxID=2058213 RepID=UPI0013FE275D|nr:hypothetical protein [Marinicaulis flavus]